MSEIKINNTVIANKIKICNNFFSKFKGLRFSKPLKKDESLIIIASKESVLETTIDMLFVFFPIDIIWLDKNKKVIDIKRNVKPFSPLILPEKPAKYIIELPKNTSKNIKIDDVIKLEHL